jgi:hypothetical protein
MAAMSASRPMLGVRSPLGKLRAGEAELLARLADAGADEGAGFV